MYFQSTVRGLSGQALESMPFRGSDGQAALALAVVIVPNMGKVNLGGMNARIYPWPSINLGVALCILLILKSYGA